MVLGRRFMPVQLRAPHTGREGGNGDDGKRRDEGGKDVSQDERRRIDRESSTRTVPDSRETERGREEREGHN